MTGDLPSEADSFSTTIRKVVLNGLDLFHSHCRLCGRDFVRNTGTHHWNAAYIGAFGIEVCHLRQANHAAAFEDARQRLMRIEGPK